ncbi:cell wall hydrolase [Novispirillum sp. DQ9]|uniref:cell wall hydrolase n=1 Tax=Novispirillum sp. DQ9 TaxID=3398612 RepID=UPI003C7E0540
MSAPRLVPRDPRAMPVREVLARTLYGEARGESLAGKEAVACVILNRVARAQARGGSHWWGRDVAGVCLKPWQFSCWNATDPNRDKLLSVTESDRAFRACLDVADRALAGTLADSTRGATHYHTRTVTPAWSRGRTPCAEVGAHVFYNDVE